MTWTDPSEEMVELTYDPLTLRTHPSQRRHVGVGSAVAGVAHTRSNLMTADIQRNRQVLRAPLEDPAVLHKIQVSLSECSLETAILCEPSREL